jgi:hypothetical protein
MEYQQTWIFREVCTITGDEIRRSIASGLEGIHRDFLLGDVVQTGRCSGLWKPSAIKYSFFGERQRLVDVGR